jgi:quercetin dioxygenase-like cupin family protein
MTESWINRSALRYCDSRIPDTYTIKERYDLMKNITLKLLALFILAMTMQVFAESSQTGVPGGYPSVELISSGTDVLGRPLTYPDCKPLIKSLIITMAPGQTGKIHQHLTPLYAYMLSGKIKVTYKDEANTTNTYSAGDALMEAMHIDHYGFNPFDEPASLLAVYMECEN